ncbi:unnamed protein product [Owenia fusiformis]|uniref:Ion transport domain-containing protein n=1 Tax=Owenia fusiformis TaxID=6347 RepID=A0A8J1XLT9_OWEFU|nr:unnamed protein product [Owenia fusiformis]
MGSTRLVQYEQFHDEQDVANEASNMATDIPANEDSDDSPEQRQHHWSLNYQEAAIYLEEGYNNDKFETHPQSQNALPIYLLTHRTWFYIVDFLASTLLLSLALIERPAVPLFKVPVWIHGSVELLCLFVIALELIMRLKWLGVKQFVKHVRTVVKTTTLTVMFAEAIVVLIRQQSHFRVTRAFRPIFLIDSHYCRGVRRFIRQVLQSMPPILDMLILLLFFMLIFSILGFYLFSPFDDPYFNHIETSFISLFVLLTTSNFPDVMMPSYSRSRWSAIFFIVYLAVELYFLMNLLLAVVYDTFTEITKKKLKKLLLHKREACQRAFRLLVTKQNPTRISLRHFVGVMKYFNRRLNKRDLYLCFKGLNISKTGEMNLDEFYHIYYVTKLKWGPEPTVGELWSTKICSPCCSTFIKAMNRLVTWRWFTWFIYFVIAVNFVWILAETIDISVDPDIKAQDYKISWYTLIFVAIYVVEMILKILGLGPKDYFTSGWNLFDFFVTMAALVGILGKLFNKNLYYIVILRPFRLLRLFKMKARYRDVLGTLFILLSQMMSLALAMILLYYFFAIVGMELFSKYDLRDCCKNTSVEDNYRYDNNSVFQGYYYLNNFENVLISGVTLFELTVVNNWYIIMEGYATVATSWSRIYFMLFYIVIMVVMNVVVAFILEAFIFRIQYRRQMSGDDIGDFSKIKVDVQLSHEELNMCLDKVQPLTSQYINCPTQTEPHRSVLRFRGERSASREDYSVKMYQEEVQQWVLEQQERLRAESAEMQDLSHVSHNVNGVSESEDNSLHARTITM